MNDAPVPDEQFLNTNDDTVLTYVTRDDGAYLFSRPNADSLLEVPTDLWFDDDIDFYESIGRA